MTVGRQPKRAQETLQGYNVLAFPVSFWVWIAPMRATLHSLPQSSFLSIHSNTVIPATIPATTHSHHSFAKTLSACRVPIR